MKKIGYLLLVWIALAFQVTAQEVTFQGQAQGSVLLGDKFQLVYSLNTGGSDLRLAEMTDFEILMGPSTSRSYSMTSINGSMKQETTYAFTYVLKATREGRLTIPPATIVVKGEKITSNPVIINVVKGSDPASSSAASQESSGDEVGSLSSEELFVTQSLNRTSVFQGQGAVLTTRIYTRVDINGISDIKQPELSQFVVQDLIGPESIQWNVENVNGKTYNVGTYQSKVLLPQKTGKLTIEPVQFEFLIKQRVSRRSSSIFDDFFESNQRIVKAKVKSKPVSIQVNPLPASAPESFGGGVGDFRLKASLSKEKMKVDDGVTLQIEISGEGNLRVLDGPKLKFPTDFDTFDPKVTNNFVTSTMGSKGSKSFEYLIIPRHSGQFVIPQIQFTYFSPVEGRYKTLSAGPFSVDVEKGDGSASSGVSFSGTGTREQVKYLGKDIRFIKNETGDLTRKNDFLLGSFPFWLSLTVPIALFVLAFLLYRKRLFEDANLHVVKNRKANKIARKRLGVAYKLLKNNQKEAFYDEVMRALWGYLSNKLNLTLSSLTKDNARFEMTQKGISEALSDEFMNLLDTCEFARYAPASVSGTMEELYLNTVEVIGKIENQVK